MTLLSVRNLRVDFASDRGLIRAVQGVSFALDEGEILGIVGESGSGKSVSALAIMRMLSSPPARITADALNFRDLDILTLTEAEARQIRGHDIAMVFQDPMRSLNPVLTIGRQITEVLRRHLALSHAAARSRAIDLLGMVGIPFPKTRLSAYPHQFSGGMRQRVMIAIALSCNPKLLIADEATTALDVTIQAQIVDLVKRLARDLGTAVIWITHDLGMVAGMCDRVAVMYAGRIVETGLVDDVFARPAHGYTMALLAATPRIDGLDQQRLRPIEGMPPDLSLHQPLCPFLPRCAISIDQCRTTPPPPRTYGAGHHATCLA